MPAQHTVSSPFPKPQGARQPLGSHLHTAPHALAGWRNEHTQPLWPVQRDHRDRRPSALRANACPPTLPIKVLTSYPANATKDISPGWSVTTVQFHGRDESLGLLPACPLLRGHGRLESPLALAVRVAGAKRRSTEASNAVAVPQKKGPNRFQIGCAGWWVGGVATDPDRPARIRSFPCTLDPGTTPPFSPPPAVKSTPASPEIHPLLFLSPHPLLITPLQLLVQPDQPFRKGPTVR